MKMEKIDVNDLIGQKFSKWTLIGDCGYDRWGDRKVLCRCECGNERELRLYHLMNGKTKGCLSCRRKRSKETNNDNVISTSTFIKHRKIQRNNTSGYVGISQNQKKWSSTIKIDKKVCYLGVYDTQKEALAVLNSFIVINRLPYEIQEYRGELSIINSKQKKLEKEHCEPLLNNEVWKDIPGYNGLYAISNKGRVRNNKRNKILAFDQSTIYNRVNLFVNGRMEKKYIHKLVAENFIFNPYNSNKVHHVNSNLRDNRVENLRWYA